MARFPTPSRTRWRHLAGLLLFACAAAAAWVPQAGQAQSPATSAAALERSVKAAFLYKFLGYAEFPATAFADGTAPVVIGVAGSDEMAGELTRIVAGRTVNGRPIAVRSLREPEAAVGVHLLFLAGTDGARVGRWLRAAPQQPMLVVSEAPDGLPQGSVINFNIIDERVRFDVSLDAADRWNVKLSSRLLTVAHQVRKGVN
ncbi:YfiR family protein [Massilia arenosa]|uniref:YfiR family protein n=1 Tax=Zemynaea arenosa TaxID=2561931 RepID=A0A4Y9SSS4_9BURK|nr:YfiR family protein [Massilia arenosa]TFW28547.1 YfiR family protein [Massilia arenosa]